jgi:hypothetical protein
VVQIKITTPEAEVVGVEVMVRLVTELEMQDLRVLVEEAVGVET